jgi:PTH1 family peptidyl-tRNA hydrolase
MVKLVVGLGNPGRKYSKTRHNLGYMVVDLLAKRFESSFRKKKGDFRQSAVSISGRNILLIKPTAYMNLSGVAVKQAAEYHGFDPCEILVVCDDFNLPSGKIRIRDRGSDGGHKGLRSTIEELQTENFPRLRMGIGLPEEIDYPVEAFVLENFGKDERKAAEKMIEDAATAVETIIEQDIEAAQHKYN